MSDGIPLERRRTGLPPVADRSRRQWLAGAAALGTLALLAPPARADGRVGPVQPREPAPALTLRRHDGRSIGLREQLRGRWTVAQLMFAGCSAVCPVQGALFGALQAALAGKGWSDVHLLSLSIDPLGDDPATLRAWLRRYDAGARWQAGAPAPKELDPMLDALGAIGQTVGDRHSTQALIFDPAASLAWRTTGLPPTGEIIRALELLRRSPSAGAGRG